MAVEFNVDFKKLTNRLNAHFLRKPVMTKIFNSWTSGIKTINDSLLTTRSDIDKKLSYTAETINLERFLNDELDDLQRRIFIDNVADITFDYIHNKIESQPPVFLNNKSEATNIRYWKNLTELQTEFDYIVNIPSAITFDEEEVRELVNIYNSVGKRFDIQTF